MGQTTRATLNRPIEYRDGYVTPVGGHSEPITVDDAEIIMAGCRGWGDSNAVVRHDGNYYLATIDE